MLQDTQTIRHYQKLTDALVEMWNRGYRFDDLRLYLDGYLAALRHSNSLEPLYKTYPKLPIARKFWTLVFTSCFSVVSE
ncbi:DUF6761 family protein [Oscillatoria nigro-viridis]|uniref:DUF6761 family protein n=1 Tax=Phormidium nigroviride TaxID=482564 RepID=UPI00030CA0D7|nr:DUF6761 family protein [Oscillatoria nigro-viridis]